MQNNASYPSLPEPYSSPAKRMTFANLVELHSSLPARPETEFKTNVLLSTQLAPMNTYIDQLKADLFNSQKYFVDKTKEIKVRLLPLSSVHNENIGSIREEQPSPNECRKKHDIIE